MKYFIIMGLYGMQNYINFTTVQKCKLSMGEKVAHFRPSLESAKEKSIIFQQYLNYFKLQPLKVLPFKGFKYFPSPLPVFVIFGSTIHVEKALHGLRPLQIVLGTVLKWTERYKTQVVIFHICVQNNILCGIANLLRY